MDRAWEVIQNLSPQWCDIPCSVRAGCGCADVIEQALNAEREACVEVAEAQAQVFLSPEYATNQPISSVAERMACRAVADAIRTRIDNSV